MLFVVSLLQQGNCVAKLHTRGIHLLFGKIREKDWIMTKWAYIFQCESFFRSNGHGQSPESTMSQHRNFHTNCWTCNVPKIVSPFSPLTKSVAV